MLISFAVTGKLICVFVFAYAKSRYSQDEAHLLVVLCSDYFVQSLSCGKNNDCQFKSIKIFTKLIRFTIRVPEE